MSELLFRRAVRFTILVPNQRDRRVEGLRVAFQIEKAEAETDSTPNSSNITIYNLNEQSRTLLESKGAKISLDVGYSGELGEPAYRSIFTGDIVSVSHGKAQASLVTKVEALDGIVNYQTAKINQSFDGGATTRQVFTALSNALALPLGDLSGLKQETFLGGYVATGLVRDQLNILTKRLGAVWSIQDGKVEIRARGVATRETLILLNPQTGLIGSPSKKEDKKIEFRALLNPKLRIARRVQIDSRFVVGIHKINKVTHEGDSYDGVFHSVCVAEVST